MPARTLPCSVRSFFSSLWVLVPGLLTHSLPANILEELPDDGSPHFKTSLPEYNGSDHRGIPSFSPQFTPWSIPAFAPRRSDPCRLHTAHQGFSHRNRTQAHPLHHHLQRPVPRPPSALQGR